MSEETKIVSKVLVHECDESALSVLKDACSQNNLVGLKVSTGDNSIGLKDITNEIDDVLRSNVDLGAIFLAEAPDHNNISGVDLCIKIHKARPELPIFLRRNNSDNCDDLPEAAQEALAGCYHTNDIKTLNDLINEYICSMYYPVELAKGIQEISCEVFRNLISGDVQVRCDQPYLVKDQIIYGELFSLIPLESSWCRGYMMLQTTEREIQELIRSERTFIQANSPGSRETNSILNEMTNMVWGGIKSRYFSGDELQEANRTQVPIIVNHAQKHISFGSTEPQLCLKYTLHDPQHKFPDFCLYQRLIFNLSWSPEKFAESDKAIEDFVDNGELELF